MMDNFTQILRWLSTKIEAPSTNSHFSKNFPIVKKSPSPSLRPFPMSYIGGRLTMRNMLKMSLQFLAKTHLADFVDALKEKYYSVGNYDD
jgi:hypothetical protein